MTTEAKQYAQRNRQGSDWFYHDKPAAVAVAEKPVEPINDESETAKPVSNEPEVEEIPCETSEEVPAAAAQAQLIKPKSDSNQWYKHDQTGPQEVKSPRTQKEGEMYCKRDKMGSSSSWFKHDHDEGDSAQQQRPTTAGSANAARMRSESEHWYNHDGASNVEPSKRFSARPVSSEIHGVFHHQNAGNQ